MIETIVYILIGVAANGVLSIIVVGKIYELLNDKK
jgi:uncharacterized membrane protein YuzA (DUF378 family)